MNKSVFLGVLLASAALSLFTILGVDFFSSSSTTTTYIPAAWPNTWHPVALSNNAFVQDTDDLPGVGSNYLDVYSSDNPHMASAFMSYENSTCFFRVQLQASPGTVDNMFNGTWIAQIKNLNTGIVGAVAIDGNKLQVSVVGVTNSNLEDIIYADQGPSSLYRSAVAISPVWPQPTVTVKPNSANNYYLDFQVPISALNGGTTQLGITDTTEMQLFFGTSQASTHTGVINKDWMIGNSVTWSTVDSTSFGTLGGSPLPVELASFHAFLKSGVTELAWNTATETNNYGFFVLRSADQDVWEELGFVPGAGNSSVPKFYKFNDVRPPKTSDVLYYRLRQTDRDGSIEYSPVTMVHNSAARTVAITDAYPNPFNPTTTVSFSLDNRSSVRLSLVDINGSTVKVIVDAKQLEAGSHSVTVDAGNLPSGKYLLALQTPSKMSIHPVVLMK